MSVIPLWGRTLRSSPAAAIQHSTVPNAEVAESQAVVREEVDVISAWRFRSFPGERDSTDGWLFCGWVISRDDTFAPAERKAETIMLPMMPSPVNASAVGSVVQT